MESDCYTFSTSTFLKRILPCFLCLFFFFNLYIFDPPGIYLKWVYLSHSNAISLSSGFLPEQCRTESLSKSFLGSLWLQFLFVETLKLPPIHPYPGKMFTVVNRFVNMNCWNLRQLESDVPTLWLLLINWTENNARSQDSVAFYVSDHSNRLCEWVMVGSVCVADRLSPVWGVCSECKSISVTTKI